MATKTHKPHPRCSCGRSLFKSFEKGARVLTTDPYRFCRNADCPRSGHQGAAGHQGQDAAPERPPVRARKSRQVGRATRIEAASADLPGVAAARARIRELVKRTTDGAPASAIGLVLALVTQETGNKEAANALIKEHNLDKLFGLQVQ